MNLYLYLAPSFDIRRRLQFFHQVQIENKLIRDWMLLIKED